MCAYPLVAEDDPAQAEVLRRYLTADGHRAAVVHDGRVALERIRRRPPDLLVLDLTAYRDNQREWYRCAEAAGYELTAPDPDTGQFGLTEIGPNGDAGSPGMLECERRAFED